MRTGAIAFAAVPTGNYTLLVIAPGFLEWQEPISAAKEEILVALAPEVVEMETIVVTAKMTSRKRPWTPR